MVHNLLASTIIGPCVSKNLFVLKYSDICGDLKKKFLFLIKPQKPCVQLRAIYSLMTLCVFMKCKRNKVCPLSLSYFYRFFCFIRKVQKIQSPPIWLFPFFFKNESMCFQRKSSQTDVVMKQKREIWVSWGIVG